MLRLSRFVSFRGIAKFVSPVFGTDQGHNEGGFPSDGMGHFRCADGPVGEGDGYFLDLDTVCLEPQIYFDLKGITFAVDVVPWALCECSGVKTFESTGWVGEFARGKEPGIGSAEDA
jgi:hypothetical protein